MLVTIVLFAHFLERHENKWGPNRGLNAEFFSIGQNGILGAKKCGRNEANEWPNKKLHEKWPEQVTRASRVTRTQIPAWLKNKDQRESEIVEEEWETNGKMGERKVKMQ